MRTVAYTVKKLVCLGHQIWCPGFVTIWTLNLVSPVHLWEIVFTVH